MTWDRAIPRRSTRNHGVLGTQWAPELPASHTRAGDPGATGRRLTPGAWVSAGRDDHVLHLDHVAVGGLEGLVWRGSILARVEVGHTLFDLFDQCGFTIGVAQYGTWGGDAG